MLWKQLTWKSWSSIPNLSRRLRKTMGQYSLNLKWLGMFSLKQSDCGIKFRWTNSESATILLTCSQWPAWSAPPTEGTDGLRANSLEHACVRELRSIAAATHSKMRGQKGQTFRGDSKREAKGLESEGRAADTAQTMPPTGWSEVEVPRSCPALCDPMHYTVRGILQARILKWVAFPFTRGSSQSRDRTHVSRIAGRFFISWATREAL